MLAAFGCTFAGLCYAEFASLIPIAGSAYTYAYATLGELFAWIIGWDLILEYAFGAATVASGWSGYVLSFWQDFGIRIPPQSPRPAPMLVKYQGHWEHLQHGHASRPASILRPCRTTGAFQPVAFLAILAVTVVLVIGIKESANLNTAIVIIKVSIVLVFIGVVGFYAGAHPAAGGRNWHPFIPPNLGTFGAYGWSGIARGAAVIFFAYIGFDAVSTAAQEAKNPKRDMPIGILGSLVICTVLYILVSGLLTGLVPYTALNVSDPVAVGIDAVRVCGGEVPGANRRHLRAGHGDAGDVAGPVAGLLFHVARRIAAALGRRHPSRASARRGSPRIWWASVVAIFARVDSHWHFGRTGEHWDAAGVRHRLRRSLGPAVKASRLAAAFQDPAGAAGAHPRDRHLPGTDGEPAGKTWLRLIIWLIVGLVMYFTYGRRHSKVSKR